jgi:uncharacterized LabA/DUF88 family protein
LKGQGADAIGEGRVGNCIGFVDAGYLKAAGGRTLGMDINKLWPVSQAVVSWFQQAASSFPGERFLRVYWYDGQHDPRHRGYAAQRVFFDAISRTPGLQFRGGHLVERTPKWQAPVRQAIRESARQFHLDPEGFLADFEQRFRFMPEWQQKGVDTLIVLDLVRLAQQGAYTTGVLIAGDRDLAEAVRVAQAMGRRVVVAHPQGDGIATELRHLADQVRPISKDDVARMLEPRPQPRRPEPVPAGI